MALVTLQTIFQDAFPAYEQSHTLPAHVRRAAHAIMPCRHRSCPQCAYLQTERWLALQQARLRACDHYHVIFTLPHELNPPLAGQCPRDDDPVVFRQFQMGSDKKASGTVQGLQELA